MIVIIAFILGAFYGWYRARKLHGNRADQVQFAIGFALAFTVAGLLATVILDRMI